MAARVFRAQYDADTGVEVDHICRASFDKRLPFNVKEQSLRSCLCVNCYKAKLITTGLHENWAALHSGTTAGAACSCTCDFCKGSNGNGGCDIFLKNKSPKSVFSMKDFSDSLLCPKEVLYSGRTGDPVEGHRLACVSGHCMDCRKKQELFFKCPQHQGDATRPFPTSSSSFTGDAGERPGIITWKEFTDVDDAGRPKSPRRGRQDDDVLDHDEDWSPSGDTDKARQRKVNKGMSFDLALRKALVADGFLDVDYSIYCRLFSVLLEACVSLVWNRVKDVAQDRGFVLLRFLQAANTIRCKLM